MNISDMVSKLVQESLPRRYRWLFREKICPDCMQVHGRSKRRVAFDASCGFGKPISYGN